MGTSTLGTNKRKQIASFQQTQQRRVGELRLVRLIGMVEGGEDADSNDLIVCVRCETVHRYVIGCIGNSQTLV